MSSMAGVEVFKIRVENYLEMLYLTFGDASAETAKHATIRASIMEGDILSFFIGLKS